MPTALTTTTGVLTANAVDPSGLYTTSATSSFTVTAGNPNQPAGTVTSGYDGDGNVTSRSWTSGVTQTLTWDAFNRLIKVSQRDSSNNGYDWTALYDGLGRRISTTLQPIANNTASGTATVTASIYDPQVEFLEIGVSVNGVKAWKAYGVDLNGRFGGLQGTGGLEATILDSNGTTTGVLNDFFGNGVATVSGGAVTWNTTHVGGYGPLPDSAAQPLTNIAQLASAVAWRGHYIDPTGFYNLGARYYEPTSGRFLSPDPKGQAASMSLYDFCNGDPVNSFDPDGRCPDTPILNSVINGQMDSNYNSGTNYPYLTNYGNNIDDPNTVVANGAVGVGGVLMEAGLVRDAYNALVSQLTNTGQYDPARDAIRAAMNAPENSTAMSRSMGALYRWEQAASDVTTSNANPTSTSAAMNSAGAIAKYGGGALMVTGVVTSAVTVATSSDPTRTGAQQSAGIIVGYGGAEGGAYVGGAIGTAICPGLGTGIGALVGSVVGAISGSYVGQKMGSGAYNSLYGPPHKN